MKPRILSKRSLGRTAVVICGIAVVLTMAGCGGSGGGGGTPLPQDENVTITGKVDDGTANSPIQFARCRFVDQNGVPRITTSNANGEYSIVVPPNVVGMISCSPENLINLKLYTFSSTMGKSAGETIFGENVTPVTTVVAQIIQSESPADPIARKEELLRSIQTGQDPELSLVVLLSTWLYKAMLQQNINVNYGGDGGGNGGNGGDGGVGGGAGDGGDFSPIANARCEFIVSNDIKNGNVLYDAALADFVDDGIINRPDISKALYLNYPEFQNLKTEDIKAAFEKVFPSGIGHAYTAVTDANGRYFLPIPPNVPGFVRCLPPNQEKLILATYVPERQPGITLEGQDVNPATTIFSTNVATKIGGDLETTKNNFLDDIIGLDVQILQEGGNVSGFQLRPGTAPSDKNVGLVAFSATALFNIFYKNDLNVDYPAALDDLTKNKGVDPDFLQKTFFDEISEAQSQDFAAIVNMSVEEAGVELDPENPVTLEMALSKAGITVTVIDSLGQLIPNAIVEILNLDQVIVCDNCTYPYDLIKETNDTGYAIFELSQVPTSPSNFTIRVNKEGYREGILENQDIIGFADKPFEVVLINSFPLAVQTAGNGSGTVISNPSGINCGTDCSQDYEEGTSVTLTANPAGGSTFSGWSGGGCSGTGQCTVTMNQARTVTATFTPIPQPPPDYILTVTRAGTGSGTVTSVPSGINCGTDCTQDYIDGTQVTLTANPTSGSDFSGWSGGGCSGTGQCTVNMNQAQTVTANFTALFTLTVQGGSNGTGFVSSNPEGISCSINGTTESGDCSQAYGSNTLVTLTPDQSGSSTFTGWSGGGCSGTGQCTVTMNQARTVTANFTAPFTLTVQGGSTGTGFVSSNPTGISCSINGTTESGDCSQAYSSNTLVTLTPDQSGGSTFTGWSGGGCSGTDPCTVTMNQSQTVIALFTLPPIAPTISNIRQQLVDSQYTCIRSDGSTFTGYYYRISVNYDDPNGDVTRGDEAVVRLDGVDFQWYSFSGDGFTGTATADPCYESEQSGRRFSVTVVDGAGFESNSLSITIP